MERFHTPRFTSKSRFQEERWGRREGLEVLSDSSSCSGYSTEEDSFSYTLRPRRSLKQTSEAPIKKLLAEELSNNMEPKRRTPSVIGKLMGLDPLPPQQPVKKQPKKFSENYLKKTASIGYLDKKSSRESLTGRRRNKEQQDFKDVFEVLESSGPENHSNLLTRERVAKKLNETKMEFVRQKFMDVKRLSTDEKLQQSKEFHDALEILDSNKDLVLKFLQEPDSLYAKHLRDFRAVSSPPQSGQITVLHSSKAQGNLCKKADRNAEQNDLTGSLRKHDQGAISNSRRKNVYIPSELPKSQSHEKDVTCQHPTRIVVLKPNLKKVQNKVRPVSSLDSLEGFRSGHGKSKEFGGSDLYEEVRHRRDSSFELEHMKHATQESRDIAKEVARQMMYNVTSGSKMVPRGKVRGYAGDESPYSMSGNDSVYEFEAKTPTARHFNDWKRYNSFSTESSVSREAKKRLSERWMMTRKVQEIGKVSRGSTLGEMLAKPDTETRSTNFDPSVSPDGFGDRLSIHGGVTRGGSPLGISSRDGWKDECVRSLPRSRSLPASSTCFSPKTNIRYGFLGKDRCPPPKDSINWRLNNSKSVDSEQIDGLLFKNVMKLGRQRSPYYFRVGKERDHPLGDFSLKHEEQKCMDREESHPSQNSTLKPDDVTCIEGGDLSEATPSTVDIPVDDHRETTLSVNDQELSADDSNQENTPVHPTGGSSMFTHCTITEVKSPASSKEAEQPSPDSVLEPPFVEEFSPSSDSFERISADLHGLRMQLNLLKLDSSDGCSEGTEMIVSSDDDVREVSQDHPAGNNGLPASIEVNKGYSYLVDTLVDSGFHDADLDTLLKTWYSPELPVAPSVFDKLEKKYGEQLPWLRSDRKLLFDRSNLGLVELLRPHMDPHPWVKKTTGIRWNEDYLVQELWSLLVKQEKEVAESSLETAMMKEMNWYDMADYVNAVGNGVERLLFDDLIAEVVGSLVRI